MASERQIAANRQNARRSSGPRSNAGKRRSSANALRHGLSRIIVQMLKRSLVFSSARMLMRRPLSARAA
jgi:hypothetical protein